MMQHQQMPPQQHANMPYYDHSMNMMNPGMSAGPSGYNDGTYHEMQSNRYEKLNQFTTISQYLRNRQPACAQATIELTINHISRPFTWNNYDKVFYAIHVFFDILNNLVCFCTKLLFMFNQTSVVNSVRNDLSLKILIRYLFSF